MASSKARGGPARPDWATIGGLVLALAGIVGGLLLEGGSLRDVSQVTALLIVLGGTFGAVLVQTPASTLQSSLRRLPSVFLERPSQLQPLLERLLGLAQQARRQGLISLEGVVDAEQELFLAKAVQLAVDGVDQKELRQILEIDITLQEQRGHEAARPYDSAGGYAPTIGIIGAVMGLIQVMKHLDNVKEVGHGIAVAFVATIYGVGLANLLFLPMATKIRARVQQEIQEREMVLEGVLAIAEGTNPKLVQARLEPFLESTPTVARVGASGGRVAEKAA